MKTILNRDSKMNQKNREYLMHYQLSEHVANGNGLLMKLNVMLFIGCYIFYHDYPLFLASLDFSFTVYTLIFLYLIKPNMLRGKIRAFYRRDYREMKYSAFLMKFFIQGGCIRFVMLALYFLITFYLVKDNPKDIAKYKAMVLEIVINPEVSLLALIGFALSIYLVFYHERYVSIREFSNSIVDIYKSYPYTEEGAVKEFVFQKDKELELVNISGARYDEDINNSSSSDIVENHQVLFTENENNETSSNMPEGMVRRKARR